MQKRSTVTKDFPINSGVHMLSNYPFGDKSNYEGLSEKNAKIPDSMTLLIFRQSIISRV